MGGASGEGSGSSARVMQGSTAEASHSYHTATGRRQPARIHMATKSKIRETKTKKTSRQKTMENSLCTKPDQKGTNQIKPKNM